MRQSTAVDKQTQLLALLLLVRFSNNPLYWQINFIVCFVLFVFLQIIREELLCQEERLERIQSAAQELGQSVTMSPVIVELDVSIKLNRSSSLNQSDGTLPDSLATSMGQVKNKLELTRQSLDELAEAVEGQNNAVTKFNGVIVNAEQRIDNARQVINNLIQL